MEDELFFFLSKWKTTSILNKMEDDLNFLQNGRQVQKGYLANIMLSLHSLYVSRDTWLKLCCQYTLYMPVGIPG